jgi:tripartite-type tricarboxylate transporter receptor subunit TctC
MSGAGRPAGLAAIAMSLAALIVPLRSDAESAWPGRPIKLVIPYAAGGGSDIIARAIGGKLAERLGRPIIADNKPGGGGIIAVDAVAKAPPDGYTILFTTTAIATISAGRKTLPYDPVKDFTPIGEIGATPLLIVVARDSPIRTLGELVSQARAKPNSITYGSGGVGSMSHLGMELLDSVANVQMLHVPYKGMAPALTDLIAGRVTTALCTFASALPLMKGGRLRGLTVTGAQRSPFAPDLPTSAEAGFPGFHIDFWWGIVAPARIPTEVAKRLNEELNAVLAEAGTRELLAREAAVPVPGPPDQFGKLVSSDIARWTSLIRDAHVQTE